MNRKDYLKEELSKDEKGYLKKIIMSARYSYYKKNKKYIDNMPLIDEVVKADNSFIDNVIDKCLKEVKSAEKFEKTILNPNLYRYVKALSLKEKEVLFYLFWEKKQINDVAKILMVDRKTIRRIRDKALSKITNNLLNGGNKNV